MKRAVKYCLGIVIISAVTAGALPSLDVEVRRHLPDGRELVHASQGAFGPAADGIVMLYREEGCADCRYEGRALVPGKGGLYRAVPLPAIRQFDNLTVQNDGIGSVLFVDADGDGRNEVLVLVKGLRRGPGGYPLACVAVLGWDGASFRALAAYENYFGESCDSAAQVRARRGSLQGEVRTYRRRQASADATITLSENGRSPTGTRCTARHTCATGSHSPCASRAARPSSCGGATAPERRSSWGRCGFRGRAPLCASSATRASSTAAPGTRRS